jgi:hypothetical protein
MGYILIMFNHCVNVCVRVRARVRLSSRSSFNGFSSNLVGHKTDYMSYLICVWMHVLTARTCLHLRICLARDGQWLVLIIAEMISVSAFTMYYVHMYISVSVNVQWSNVDSVIGNVWQFQFGQRHTRRFQIYCVYTNRTLMNCNPSAVYHDIFERFDFHFCSNPSLQIFISR